MICQGRPEGLPASFRPKKIVAFLGFSRIYNPVEGSSHRRFAGISKFTFSSRFSGRVSAFRHNILYESKRKLRE